MNSEMERVFLDAMLCAMDGENPSNAIELQEKRGQSEVCTNGRLPTKSNVMSGVPREILCKGIAENMEWEEKCNIRDINNIEYTKKRYEELGIEVIDFDDLFYEVLLPEGWKIEPTDHDMWNKLLNENGEEVASFFYKASFYDREAFINFSNQTDI